jgi:hypothetical protein
MNWIITAAPSLLMAIALWRRTVRLIRAHERIIDLNERVEYLEGLLENPIIKLDMRLKHAANGR